MIGRRILSTDRLNRLDRLPLLFVVLMALFNVIIVCYAVAAIEASPTREARPESGEVASGAPSAGDADRGFNLDLVGY